jgi:hypothetical protein
MLARAGNRYKLLRRKSTTDNETSDRGRNMNRSRNPLRNWITALCGTIAFIACATVLADPPGRVARLAQIGGTVSFSPAGEEEWVLAQPNRPLITGDRIWSDAGSRAELQIGTASARLGSNTSATILNLDDRVAQIEIAQGTVNLRVRRVYSDQVFEIDTPNLAFSIRRAGDYRIDVDPNGDATIIRVRSGEGEAWGEGAAYVVGAGQQYTFQGTGLRDYTFDALPQPDDFDRWCFDRNRREDAALSARYVSPDVVGYSDLDEYGTWRNVEGYGNVWFPTTVAVGWVPYRTGHWGWIDPWGWTWIDEAPWGFAPFHYGRWAFVSSRWCWVPGPVAVRPIYAPALVAFIGGGGFSLSISTGPVTGIGWFPLGPGEVYRPAYAASRTYFTNVNVSNTVVNTTVVNNVYNNVNVTNIVYRNREAPGAVTAVSTAAFTGAQPVARNVIPVPREVITREQVSNVVAVAPSHASVLAAGAVAGGAAAGVAAAKRPPSAALERRVVAKTAPPPPPPSFATKASLLAAQPGKPLEPEKLKGMPPARAAEAKVKVVTPTVTPQPLSKEGGGKGARAERAATPGPTPSGAAAVPQPPQERAMRERKGAPPPQGAEAPRPPQERAMRERKGAPPPQGAEAPRPPQERAVREGRGGPPQGAQAPQPPQERAMREGRGGPPQGAQAPQPPQERAMREGRGGPPQGAQAPQPPQERAMREGRGGPPQGAQAPQPPQERAMREGRGGPPQGAQAPQPPQERAMREGRGGPPPQGAQPPQPPQERAMREGRGGPPQGAPVQQPPPQERAMREGRGGPPPQAAPAPQPPPQAAQRAPSPPPQAGGPETRGEEGKGRGKGQKDKDKEGKEGQ